MKGSSRLSLVVVLMTVLPAMTAAKMPTYDAERGLMTTAPLLKEVTPAVVSISVRVRTPAQDNPLLRDPFFRRFF